jgi:hypothetical protein
VGRQSATDQEHLEITEKDVGVAMQTFIDETDQSFYDDYLKVTRSNQPGNLFKQVLLACAIASTDENGFFTPSNVIEPLSNILNRPQIFNVIWPSSSRTIAAKFLFEEVRSDNIDFDSAIQ